MSKFIILSEPWREVMALNDIETIIVTSVPHNRIQLQNHAELIGQAHHDLFVRAYWEDRTYVLGILKPSTKELRQLVAHDVLVAQGGDMIVEIDFKDIKHITLVVQNETDDLYVMLQEFLKSHPKSSALNVPFKKKKND